MKSFVVMTYYHFMHATAMALTMDEKPNLYFAVNYLNVSSSTIQRIRETGVFSSVVALDHDEFIKAFSAELRETKGLSRHGIDSIGDKLFEEYLEPYYGKMMVDADVDDEIFIFNDFQLYYYYVSKHFKHIVGVEDGYKVLEQQMRVHKFKGVYVRLEPFVEAGYYPRPLWRQPNVDYIISSCDFDTLDDYYRNKLKILDFYDLIELNRKRFIDALKYIFEVDLSFAGDDVSILIGQPLDRCQYCDSIDYYLFNRKLIDENTSSALVIKPHPAEMLDFTLFEDKGVTVINKSFPIELLNYCDVTFERGVSFDSTSLKTLKCIKRNERVLDVERPSLKEIKSAVQRSIDGQKMTICIVAKINSMSLDSYINALSFYTKNKKIRYEVILAIDQNLPTAAEEFYSETHFKENLRKYLANKKNKNGNLSIEFDELLKGKGWVRENTQTRIVRTALDDESLLQYAMEQVAGADYFLCLDSNNLGLMVVGAIERVLKKSVRHVVAFPTYISRNETRTILCIRNAENMMCCLSNTLLHRSVLVRALAKDHLEFSLTEAMLDHLDNVTSEHGIHLSASETALLDESLDQSYFEDRVCRGLLYAESISDDEIKEEFLVRMYSSSIDEYISWLRLTAKDEEKLMAFRFIDGLSIDSGMRTKVALAIIDSLYMYREREYTRFIYKEAESLTYYQKTEAWLHRTGITKVFEKMRQSRNWLNRRVRAIRKNSDD